MSQAADTVIQSAFAPPSGSVFTFLISTGMHVKSLQSCPTLCNPELWTIAHHAPLSMGFSRQEYWSGLPCPPPGDLSDPGIKTGALESRALAGGFFTTRTTWEALYTG